VNARKIIIDTDPAIGIPGTDADDPIAIMLALQDPRLDLLAITTVFGNCRQRWVRAVPHVFCR
jgi:Inosine-uridine nucleoside N-ribohydrolase